uniref:Uncharacterized protein n=1 Tax=Vespula pensylvanica TaxID=30213 RepID=A0A834PDU4_VESPE|nr:hypothetical protein H0235_000422 [Vespula pensylvanica]
MLEVISKIILQRLNIKRLLYHKRLYSQPVHEDWPYVENISSDPGQSCSQRRFLEKVREHVASFTFTHCTAYSPWFSPGVTARREAEIFKLEGEARLIIWHIDEDELRTVGDRKTSESFTSPRRKEFFRMLVLHEYRSRYACSTYESSDAYKAGVACILMGHGYLIATSL